MATFSFDKITKIIEVDLPDTDIQIQDLIDAIRSWEDELSPAMDIPRVADAAGKDDLGAGTLVGITLTLREGWRLKFADRPGPTWVTCNVFGGNLVATDEDGNSITPIAPAAYVNTNTQASQSPSIQSLEIEELKYRIESQRGKQAAYGSTIFWSPFAGSDDNIGESEDSPKKSIEAVLSALGNNNHGDVIWCLSENPGGQTIVSANIVLSANENMQFRGPGNEFIIMPLNPDLPVFDVSINGVGFEGFQVSGGGVGTSGDGFVLRGVNEYWMSDLKISNCGEHGIHVISGDAGTMTNLDVVSNKQGGIKFEDSQYCDVQGSTTVHYNGYPNGGHGISIISGSHGIHINQGIDIHQNNGYGIFVDSSSQETFVHPDSRIFSNVSGEWLDEGTEGIFGNPIGEVWVTQNVTGASATIASGDILSALSAYDGEGVASRSDASAGSASISSGDILSALSAYEVATSGQIAALANLTSGDINTLLSAYKTSGVAGVVDLSAVSGTLDASAVSAAVNLSLSAYESTGVASKIDINSITGVSATIPQESLDYIASSISGSVVSGIGAWGDLRWSKIYGIPLQQWDVIVLEEDEEP